MTVTLPVAPLFGLLLNYTREEIPGIDIFHGFS